MKTDTFSDQRNQQGNKGRGKKKLSKPTRGGRRSSSVRSDENQTEGDPRRKALDTAVFESDDYFEIPMDVESDSTGDCWAFNKTHHPLEFRRLFCCKSPPTLP